MIKICQINANFMNVIIIVLSLTFGFLLNVRNRS